MPKHKDMLNVKLIVDFMNTTMERYLAGELSKSEASFKLCEDVVFGLTKLELTNDGISKTERIQLYEFFLDNIAEIHVEKTDAP